MHKRVLVIVGVVWLILTGYIGFRYKQHLDDEARIRQLVIQPNGPLPLGLWMRSPRAVVLSAIARTPNGGFIAPNGPSTRVVKVRGLNLVNQPCWMSFEFSDERLNGLAVYFEAPRPGAVEEVVRDLKRKYGEPSSGVEGKPLVWKVVSPVPFTLYALPRTDGSLVVSFIDSKSASPFKIGFL